MDNVNYAEPVEVPGGGKWKKVVAAVLAIVVIVGIMAIGVLGKPHQGQMPAVTVLASDARLDDGGDTHSEFLKVVVSLRVRNDTGEDVAVADLPRVNCGVNVAEAVAEDGSETLEPGAECVVTYTFDIHRQGLEMTLAASSVAYDGLDTKGLVDLVNRSIENYNDNLPMSITFGPNSDGGSDAAGQSGQSAGSDRERAEDGTASSASPTGEAAAEPDVPTEYTAALRSAQTYSDMMHMSKAAIYEQLVSEYGEKFPSDAAQYAIDNVVADWNENALKTAENYRRTMNMSTAAIYDQLVSEYGEQFTAEEAQYAVDHL